MGLLDFIKDAGERVFGDDDKEEAAYKPIRQHVEDQGISTDGMDFRFSGGALVVIGVAPSQEVREKVITIVGNIKGVAQVDDQLRVAVAQADMAQPAQDTAEPADMPWESKTYTVESGDTLGGIAKKMYGNASKYPVIFEANRPMLTDPNKIYPGQVLRIPNDA